MPGTALRLLAAGHRPAPAARPADGPGDGIVHVITQDASPTGHAEMRISHSGADMNGLCRDEERAVCSPIAEAGGCAGTTHPREELATPKTPTRP
jgi:hypothetical protein